MKTNKSILKRIKITKRGKLIRRVSGQNHFNSKESRKIQRRKRAAVSFPWQFSREIIMRMGR